MAAVFDVVGFGRLAGSGRDDSGKLDELSLRESPTALSKRRGGAASWTSPVHA